MTIKKINIENPQFIELNKQNNCIFNDINWLKIFGDNLELYGIFNEKDNLIATFYLFVEYYKKTLKIYRNPPFTPFIYLHYSNLAQNKAKHKSNEREILNLFAEFLSKIKGNIIRISLHHSFNDLRPFIWQKFKVIPNYTSIINLSNELKTIENNFSEEKKRHIKKAQNEHIIINQIVSYKEIKAILKSTFERKQIKQHNQYFDRILLDFANKNNSFAFATFDKENIMLSASFFVFDKTTAYYLFGAINEQNKNYFAQTYNIYKAIEHSKKIGLKYFDFEGSMLPEIERFFYGFGGDTKINFTINKAKPMLLEMLLKLKYRAYF